MTKPKTRQEGNTVTREQTGERRPRLPHEHDESADSQTQEQPREIMEQAYDDVESGQENTDLRGSGGRRQREVPPGVPSRD